MPTTLHFLLGVRFLKEVRPPFLTQMSFLYLLHRTLLWLNLKKWVKVSPKNHLSSKFWSYSLFFDEAVYFLASPESLKNEIFSQKNPGSRVKPEKSHHCYELMIRIFEGTFTRIKMVGVIENIVWERLVNARGMDGGWKRLKNKRFNYYRLSNNKDVNLYIT